MPNELTRHAELIERLTKLDGPDREVDAAIYNALVDDGGRIAFRVTNWAKLPGSRLDRYHDGWLIGKSGDDRYSDDLRRFTASLDAAVALVERKLPGFRVENLCEWDHEVLRARGPWMCDLVERGKDGMNGLKAKCSHAPTPAIALLIALLRALEGQE